LILPTLNVSNQPSLGLYGLTLLLVLWLRKKSITTDNQVHLLSHIAPRTCSRHEMLSNSVLTEVPSRAVPDLLLRNPARAGLCRICKANPAGAGFQDFTI